MSTKHNIVVEGRTYEVDVEEPEQNGWVAGRCPELEGAIAGCYSIKGVLNLVGVHIRNRIKRVQKL